jgi:hypothetical protein
VQRTFSYQPLALRPQFLDPKPRSLLHLTCALCKPIACFAGSIEQDSSAHFRSSLYLNCCSAQNTADSCGNFL